MVKVWSCHLARPVPTSKFTLLCSGPALQGHLKRLVAPFQNFGVLGVFMKLPRGPHLSEDSSALQQLPSWVWISDTPIPGTCRFSGAPTPSVHEGVSSRLRAPAIPAAHSIVEGCGTIFEGFSWPRPFRFFIDLDVCVVLFSSSSSFRETWQITPLI